MAGNRKRFGLRNPGSYIITVLVASIVLSTGCAPNTPDKFMARGQRLVAQKEYARAVLEFRNAARLQPKSAEPVYQMALAFLATGDYGNGYANLVRATELDPNHKGAQVKLAEVVASGISGTKDQQILADVEKRVQSALAVVPDSTDVLGALGITEYLMGKQDDAVKHLEAALEKLPQNLQAARALAVIKVNEKDFAGAEQILKKAAEDSPKSADAQLALGRFYLITRRLPDAEAVYHRALGIDPKFGAALLDLARIQFSTGRKEEGEKNLVALSALPDKQYRPLHAVYLFEQGKLEEALKEFEEQAKQDPNDREAFSRLTSAYFFLKKFTDAEKVINAALKKNPKNSDALIERSRLYLITAKFTEAQTDLNLALKYEPNSGVVRYLLGKVYQARGEQLQFRSELLEALRFEPTLLRARLELAESMTNSGAGKAAVELLNEAPENQKNLLPVLVAKNWALFGVGDRAELRKSIDAGLAVYKQAPDLVLQDGLWKLQGKDLAGARKSFEQVLAARPADTMALDSLAKIFLFEKHPAQAIQAVEKQAALQPGSAQMQTLLGNWYAMNKRGADARKAYLAALSLDPTLVRTRVSLAFQDIADGNFDSARQTLTALASSSPPMRAEMEATLGMLEEKATTASAAIPHYRKALEADPSNLIALNNLAYQLANTTDQLDEALKYAQQAKELDPKNMNVEDTIGWALYRKGIYDSAIRHLQSAAAQRDGNAVWKYHLAMACWKAGDQKRGRRVLDEALSMNASLPEAAAASQLIAPSAKAN